MIKESEVLEHIGAAIDELDAVQLADLHNQLYKGDFICWFGIQEEKGWHLVSKEGSH